MKSWTLLSGAVFVLLMGGVSSAQSGENPEEVTATLENSASPSPSVSWDDFDDPEFDPSEESARETATAEGVAGAAEEALVHDAVGLPSVPAAPDASGADVRSSQRQVTSRGHTVVLGPRGVDEKGQIGRVHLVARGDTLWDISEAYLGTPWVWPSVWNANQEIADPHVISPGDRLWITAKEMRAVSHEEAVEMLAGAAESEQIEDPNIAYEDFEVAGEIDEMPSEEMDADPASAEDGDAQIEHVADDSLPDGALDLLPVDAPRDGDDRHLTGRVVRVTSREQMSFISDEEVRAATSLIGTTAERMRLSLTDIVYVGLGEGDVVAGDEFTIYRNLTKVTHPTTADLLGYHTEILGWIEVLEVDAESSIGVIRASTNAIVVGDKAVRRSVPSSNIEVRFADEGIEGIIAYLPNSRSLMATSDFVFLDLGAEEGLEVGTDLEVYEPGTEKLDTVQDVKLLTPDRLIADLVVVTVSEGSSVAFVANTRRGLRVGDMVRGATRHFPTSF